MANKKGSPNFDQVRNKDTRAATEFRSRQADEYALEIGRTLHGYSLQGLSKNKMADTLNDNGVRTIRGKLWSAKSVSRLFQRLAALSVKRNGA